MPRLPERFWFTAPLVLVGVLALLIVAPWLYIRWANTVPPYRPKLPPMPNPNGYERAAVLGARLPPEPTRDPRLKWWPDGPTEALGAAVRPARATLDRVPSTFRLPWRAPPVLSTQVWVPEQARLRVCARYLAADSLIAARKGDTTRAFHRGLDVVEFGSHLPRGGDVKHALIGLAISAMGCRCAEPLVFALPGHAVPAALSRVRRLRTGWPTFAESVEADRIFTLAHWSKALQEYPHRTPGDTLRFLTQPFSVPASARQVMLPHTILLPKGPILRAVDRYYRQIIAESRKPIAQRSTVPVSYNELALFCLPGLENLEEEWWFARTELALLETALAVRMHRVEHGRFPKGLTEISRRWLPEPLLDPWDQPLVYRLRDGKPLLYSLGPDSRDDHGSPIAPWEFTARSTGDLVFGTLGRRQPPPAQRPALPSLYWYYELRGAPSTGDDSRPPAPNGP